MAAHHAWKGYLELSLASCSGDDGQGHVAQQEQRLIAEVRHGGQSRSLSR